MSWIFYTFSAVAIWTFENVVDRHVVSQKCRHPVIGMILRGVVLFICFALISFFAPEGIHTHPVPVFLAVLIGFLGSGIDYAYYKSLQFGEVSRVASLFSTSTLFTLGLAAVVLGERFPATAYIGIFFILAGGAVISIRRIQDTFKMDRPALFALSVGFLSALYGLFVKLATAEVSILNLLFWIGLGQFIVVIFLYARFHRKIDKTYSKAHRHGIRLFVLTDILDVLALFLILLAYASGPLTLVSALEETKPLLVFLTSFGVAALKPSFIRERFTKKIFFKRLLAATLIVAGALLIIR